MGLIGPDAVHTSVDLRSGDDLSVVVTWTSPGGPSPDGRLERDFSLLRDSAGQAGIAVEVQPIQRGTRLAWSLPLCVSAPPADLRGSSSSRAGDVCRLKSSASTKRPGPSYPASKGMTRPRAAAAHPGTAHGAIGRR
jgi:hypothetical protein